MASHPNADLLQRFYEAFAARDPEVMAASYAPDAHFSDPVFPDLRGDQIGDMWRMLCHGGKDLQLTFSNIQADDTSGSAHWEARYTFSATGRRVHNVIDASFELRDGVIVRHRDHFDLWRWARMALGPLKGGLLGWTPLVKNAVRAQAGKGLAQFSQKG